jgi:ArsR family transcriptional regulator, arsenate/arsenite/antimonite-responsive transcriptional repressor / arsenate reductase (thioredoxin)
MPLPPSATRTGWPSFGCSTALRRKAVRPTEIAAALNLKPNTLSHHLADLTASRLVTVTRDGRSLYYAVNLDVTEDLIGYLALDIGPRPDLLAPLLSPLLTSAKEPAMRDTDFDVLFICSGNSARSIFAEVLLRDLGKASFRRFRPAPAPTRTEPLRARCPHPQRA